MTNAFHLGRVSGTLCRPLNNAAALACLLQFPDASQEPRTTMDRDFSARKK
jgi:hypothetical protein